MSKKLSVADVLWKAANEHLWDGDCDWLAKHDETCIAVLAAEGKLEAWRQNAMESGATPFAAWAPKHSATIKFLCSLGLGLRTRSPFSEFSHYSRLRQGARYAWLMFAYEVAKSEGL